MNAVPMVAHVPDYDYDVVDLADAPTHSTRHSPTHTHARAGKGGSEFSAKGFCSRKNKSRQAPPWVHVGSHHHIYNNMAVSKNFSVLQEFRFSRRKDVGWMATTG